MELIDIFKNNPCGSTLSNAVNMSARLNMHNTGKNLKDAIQQMDEFETESKKNVRQKYARSNRDIMNRLHAPIDKVFYAKGGSQFINLPEKQEQEFTAFLNEIRPSLSLFQMIKTLVLNAYIIDPNGLIFIEIDQDGNPYPTYKSSNDIFYYDLQGRKCNMVIFKLSQQQATQYGLEQQIPQQILDRMGSKSNKSKYYRVVDAVSDKIVEWDGRNLNEIIDLTILNPFLECPAFIVSDLYEFDSNLFVSPDYPIIELANSYLVQNSVFEIWKNLHMFPKHWTIQTVCPTCNKSGLVHGIQCGDCHGTGYKQRTSVRDEIVIPAPESVDGKITLPTAFDGYTTPPIDAWNLATDDLDRLYTAMYYTLWGTLPELKPQISKGGDKTATQVLEEKEGMISALKNYTSWYESTTMFIVDFCGKLLYPTTYKGCSFKAGDRYSVESPNSIWDKYSSARTTGASQAVLDGLLRDYFEAKYQNNPIQLEIALKQLSVEPWVHATIQQVLLMQSVSDLDKTCKTYFSEWKSTLTDMDWVINTDEKLRELMIAYCTPKVVVEVEPKTPNFAQQ